MLTPIRRSILSFILISFALSSGGAASLSVNPESSLWLVGDSTLHPFTSKTSELTITSELAPGSGDALAAILDKQSLTKFEFSLPVTSLKSKEKGLDKNMYKALNAEKCPTIDFHMTKYEVRTSSWEERPAQASGTLRINCQEKPVTLDVSLKSESGALRVKGQYTLKMTEYGVKPPSLMLGTIKVKDPVVIHYDLGLTLQ